MTVDIEIPADSTRVRNLDATITLPSGLTFYDVAIFNVIVTGGGVTDQAVNTPNVGDTSFTFENSNLHFADWVDPGTTIQIQFHVSSTCFNGGDVTVQLAFDDCCNTHYTPAATTQTIAPRFPDLEVTVTRIPTTSNLACGTGATYEIDAINNGSVTATYAQIRATLGEWLVYESSTPPTVSGGTDSSTSGPGM